MGNVDRLYNALLDNLENQHESYSELLALADKKRDILIKGDIKLLEEITSIEQEIVIKLGKMEDEREYIISRIAEGCKKDVSEVDGKFLESMIPEEKAFFFKEQKEKLKAVLHELAEKNKTNERLINKALEYIQYSLRVITEAGRQETGYNACGNPENKSVNFIDRKA
ncbi:MAG: flagellar protein FlgN [Thermoanaerobacterales bacterium]|jgi:flagellar biosynthesis/type III secretory pathway chaperone|nr:flagellar protein FlgN [Thermoanaerobacterales bacterium]